MSSSLAQNAIAFLIDLAEQGEIDPWDVQVIEVIDRFLSELPKTLPQTNGRSLYEANLSQSGQAFLYASMLVLLKADTLARLEQEQINGDEAFEGEAAWDGFSSDQSPLLPRNLERRIRRRASAAPPPSRRVTLPELIEQLELIAATMVDQGPRARRVRHSRQQSKRQAVRAIAQLAHQENLSEVAAILEQFLAEYWAEPDAVEEWLDFEQLLSLWPVEQAPTTPSRNGKHPETAHALEQASDRVGIFWALLFLSAQSKVELSQDEFYRDLKVRHLTIMQDHSADQAAIALPE